MSLFVWYFGTHRTYDDIAHHTILLGPRYRELLGDIFDRKVLAEDFSLYLHRPTATDPSLAPAGCDAFYVLSPVPHLQSGTDWSKVAETYRQAIQARLEERLLPGPRRAGRDLAPCSRRRISRTGSRRSAVPPSGSSRCSRRAPGSGRTTAAKRSIVSISSAPERIPAPGSPACSRRHAFSTRSFPMQTLSFAHAPDVAREPQPAFSSRRAAQLAAADLDACKAMLANGSRTFLAASWLLPRRVRAPACALYAFCRVADDAIGLGSAGAHRRRAGLVAPAPRRDLPRRTLGRRGRPCLARRRASPCDPARAARGLARRLRLGRCRAPLRDPRRPAGLRRPRRRRGRRDDGGW